MQLKTPGIYVRDISPPQPFDPLIETALPAFIGHTEFALDGKGDSLLYKPVRIQELTEYQSFFGVGFVPKSYRVYVDRQNQNAVEKAEIERQYFLYECLLQFYENGGRDCIIVSVGNYGEAVKLGDVSKEEDGLLRGLAVIAERDEPTLIVSPDAVNLPVNVGKPEKLGTFHQEALKQCEALKDRFLIADVALQGSIADPVAAFRNQVGIGERLKYGAVYYPWLYSNFDHQFRYSELRFFDSESEDEITDSSVFSSDGLDEVATQHQRWVADVEQRGKQVEQVLEPLVPAGYDRQTISKLSKALTERLFSFRVNQTHASFEQVMALLRPIALILPALDPKVGESPSSADRIAIEIEQVLIRLRVERELAKELALLVEIEKLPLVRNLASPPRTVQDVEEDYVVLIETRWYDPSSIDPIDADNYIEELERIGALLADTYLILFREANALEQSAEDVLFDRHPFFSRAATEVRLERKKLPPSGAMAGVYAETDQTRGVWKAPANVALKTTLGPTIALDDHDQEDLNVHSTGKSLNAIRAFRGRGIRVWGARTLAGNDNEWRYVPVRRYFNFVEEFLKKATEPFVFESNDANTWTAVRALINRFLTVQWRLGALNGAQPADAFFVNVGLNETMTSLDILEGRMIVEIGLAAVRPAEFIVVRYICRMEEN